LGVDANRGRRQRLQIFESSVAQRRYYVAHRIDSFAPALSPLPLDDSRIIESEEVAPGVILDYNEKNEVVGVEMLYLSKRTPNLKTTALEFESV